VGITQGGYGNEERVGRKERGASQKPKKKIKIFVDLILDSAIPRCFDASQDR